MTVNSQAMSVLRGCFPRLDSPVLVRPYPFSPPPPGPPLPVGGVVGSFEGQQALQNDTSTIFPSAALYRRRIFYEDTSLRHRHLSEGIRCPWTLTLMPVKQHSTCAACEDIRW